MAGPLTTRKILNDAVGSDHSLQHNRSLNIHVLGQQWVGGLRRNGVGCHALAPSVEVVTSAAERERMAADAVAAQPAYPLLAQHMNVQGSVVLQAVIGADGIIQNLHVVSGPPILSAAAQQAVREWHFKPVVQNGQAVETKAKITVNFTIKIADGSPDTVAEARSDEIQILSR